MWFNNPALLVTGDLDFVPSAKLSPERNINAIARISIIAGLGSALVLPLNIAIRVIVIVVIILALTYVYDKKVKHDKTIIPPNLLGLPISDVVPAPESPNPPQKFTPEEMQPATSPLVNSSVHDKIIFDIVSNRIGSNDTQKLEGERYFNYQLGQDTMRKNAANNLPSHQSVIASFRRLYDTGRL